ncbi:MAG: hypothetical protein AB7D36_09045 [Oscillospiraceae bacterium]
MKTFKGKKILDDICAIMEAKGLMVDMSKFDDGDDCVTFKGDWHDLPLTIFYNTTNGWFWAYNGFTGKLLATHLSVGLESEDWYDDLLNTFYEAVV